MAKASRFIPTCAVLTALAPHVHAQDSASRQDLTAIPVTRSFNLVGVGVGLLPEFSGAESYRSMVLPILRADYKDRVYVNVLQAGVWLWSADDKSVRIGLAVEPRFGYKGSEGGRVQGMADRKFSIEGGPNIQWRTSVGVVYANFYQDLSGASSGQSAQLQFIRPLVTGRKLFVNGFAGINWLSGQLNDYYFGVRTNEATLARPAYTAGATTNLQLGVNGAYAITERGSILFGANVIRLGSESSNSPIAETRLQAVVYAGYAISF